MFEHIYTTQMSADGKALQKRFTKIRSKDKRFSKTMVLTVTVCLIVTILCTTAVMALVNAKTNSDIDVFYQDTLITFKNKPFFKNSTVYLPLSELCDTIGLSEKSEIIHEKDTVSFFIEGHYNSYQITIGSNVIAYHFPEQTSETLTPYSPIKKGGTVYLPFDYIDWIFNRYNDHYDVSFIYGDINSKVPYQGNVEGMTYSYICDLQYQADNGHFPWRLSPELVVTASSGLGEGEVTILEQSKSDCRALHTAGGVKHIVHLRKPVRKDATGIWVVQSCTKTEE